MMKNFTTITVRVVNPRSIEVGKAILFQDKPVIVLQILSTCITRGKFIIECLVQTNPIANKSMPQTIFKNVPVQLNSTNVEVRTGLIVNGNGFPYKVVDIVNLTMDTLNYNILAQLNRVPTFDTKDFNRIIASKKSQSLGWHVI